MILDANFKRRKGHGWKGRLPQVEGMVLCRRMEAERSEQCVGDGKISRPVTASPYTGVTKEPG